MENLAEGRKCADCAGEKIVFCQDGIDRPCRSCGGSGKTYEEEKMKICDLTHGIELRASCFGRPFLAYKTHCGDLVPADRPEWAKIIEDWQSDPSNDCLRARGDMRWVAACEAAMLCKAGKQD
jgi:hypothetical protein